MKVFTYTEARQHLAMLLNTAREEEVLDQAAQRKDIFIALQ